MTALRPPMLRPEAETASRLPFIVEALVLLSLVFTLRLPSLFEPHHYGDEGVFAATAQSLLAGEPLYSGAWDNKPPFVFLVYAATLELFGPSMLALRLIGVCWSAAAAVAVLAIGRRVGGDSIGWLAGLLYAVLASLPMIEGTLLLTEHLMVLPVALAVLLVLIGTGREGSARDMRVAAAGALLGTAFLFKQVAALDAAAVGLWLLCLRGRPIRDATLLVTGWIVPIALTALWLVTSGALAEAWRGIFGSYGTYLDEGSAVPDGFKILRLLPAALAIGWLLWRRRKGDVSGGDLVLLWLGFAVLGATIAGRPFGHYLVQVVAPLAIVMADLTPRPPSLRGNGAPDSPGLPVSRPTPAKQPRSTIARQHSPFPRREGGRGVRSAVLALSLLTAIAGFRGFWFSHPSVTPEYYGNWLGWVAGAKSREEHDRFYSWRVPNQRELVRLIDADGGERTLYVWGEYPWLYPLSGARNPSRHSTSYQTSILLGAKEEVLGDLERDPPYYIAEELEEWRRLPGLAAFLAERYERAFQVDNTVVWRLRNERTPATR